MCGALSDQCLSVKISGKCNFEQSVISRAAVASVDRPMAAVVAGCQMAAGQRLKPVPCPPWFPTAAPPAEAVAALRDSLCPAASFPAGRFPVGRFLVEPWDQTPHRDA